MKVKDLIRKLQECNQEAKVFIPIDFAYDICDYKELEYDDIFAYENEVKFIP